MAITKTAAQLELMQKAGHLAACCHREVAARLAPGVTTLEIDRFVERWLLEQGAAAEQKGYYGYPYATCSSVNHIVCHGFPSSRPLRSGDIVTIDFVVNFQGWLADMAWTYGIGDVQPEKERLMQHTLVTLQRTALMATPGTPIGDIAAEIGRLGREAGYGVVTALVGHGIGQKLHEDPEIPNDGCPGQGPVLEEGMVITLEPVFTLGRTGDVLLGADGWSVATCDGSWGAHFEHTVAVTEDGPRILTCLPISPVGNSQRTTRQ
ncbi:type I methionyl aminopeptidase [Paenibacillus alvei]|uniref:type I methionyl aminopeptidase n=1 Tax=Paenibacillus alvei TaxID=44250 RepID=UPI0018CD7430|nr:type I methionyl aminopeptidase [Paenibacillus alvei]MBG9733059.1 methionine aminopeptidase [Paenibacillus alvei]MBG9744933.1 methionine aminopeptidase [Paenibacillus alvei]MCY9581799.1 type I methionyl aminopeptidase [Paenibacillus alvei]MCY9586865.1 type I methionyl aminopeptidase [Paenibacillus alvei]